jgi:hypothetical protein
MELMEDSMFKKFVLCTVMILMSVFLPACGPSAPVISLFNTVNLGRIKTVLNENGSGYNNYWLVVPVNADCMHLVDLKPRLEAISRPTTPSVSTLRDNQYEGIIVSYPFQNVDQIPEQIETIKRVVIEAVIDDLTARATPDPDPEAPDLTPTGIGEYYDPNHLSISISKPPEKLTGQEWNIEVIINPFLMTGLITEEQSGSSLSDPCSLPVFTYELEVSSSMKINQYEVKAEPPTLDIYSRIDQPDESNSITWSIDSKAAFEEWNRHLATEFQNLVQEAEEYEKMTPPPSEAELDAFSKSFQQRYEELFTATYTGQFYTLQVKATTPAPWFHFLTTALAPLLGLIAAILGLIITIRNLRKGKSG